MPVVPPARRAGTRTAVHAALTLAGTTLSGVPAVAAPIPGDDGDVKIQVAGTPPHRTPGGRPEARRLVPAGRLAG
ncbi:hypothetical protein ACIP4U_24735 [Streptomyces caelestis]|uniref:Uncharacterized protein n=1 Tax=Streptomyces caelestis TaxID=36816 RepID=A0A7W9H104_9ACTN|nr:hypothetical protein [Streptomyces caelestis]MBB5793700.1 hypothetical protein [Streptomyces caelestis]